MDRKRRRVSSRNARECNKARFTLDTMPPEILGIILRMLSLHDVACTVRLISRRCFDVAATVLNSEFLVAGTKLEIAIKRTKDLIKSEEAEKQLLMYSTIFHALKLIRFQYRMLKAVTWRYTHPRTRDSPASCFYGGKVLDNLNCLLRTILNRDQILIVVDKNFNYVNLQFFMRNCENFMNHFEKITERRINRSALVSGCKIVDVLDCLGKGRQLLSFRSSSRTGNPMISMHLKYVLRRAWFTCLQVPNANNEHFWRDKQRYMYLRLRRLVGSFNKHLYQKLYYEHMLLLQKRRLPTPKPPLASTYSGYGEYGGQFFYYGNMSKYAENRLRYAGSGNAENTSGEFEKEAKRPHRFDLVIQVQLRCSPELAPLSTRTSLKTDDLEDGDANSHQEFYLKLSTRCTASKTNRLPSDFTWEVRGPRVKHSQCC